MRSLEFFIGPLAPKNYEFLAGLLPSQHFPTKKNIHGPKRAAHVGPLVNIYPETDRLVFRSFLSFDTTDELPNEHSSAVAG